jgi:hypothetical protein
VIDGISGWWSPTPTSRRCSATRPEGTASRPKGDSVCEYCMAARTFEDGKIRVNDEDGID